MATRATTRWLTLAGLLLLLSQLAAQTPGLHPNPRYLDAPVPPAFTIALTARPAAAAFALAATVRAAFGSESDSEADLIGNIKSALLLPAGDVVVLDDKQSEVRIFGPTGAPRQRLGRAGRGPGEFFHPRSLTVDGGGRLYVADVARAVQVFAPSPGGYRHQETRRVDVAANAMCFLDTLLEVRAYRPDGSLLWRATSAGYKVNRIQDEERGGYSVSLSSDGVHSVHSLTLLPGRGLLVQIAFRTPEAVTDRLSFTTLHSFLLDPATGRPLPLGTALPPIFAASARDALLAFDNPVPRFEVRALQRR